MGEQVIQRCKFLQVRIFDFISNIYTHSNGYRLAKVAFAYLHMLQNLFGVKFSLCGFNLTPKIHYIHDENTLFLKPTNQDARFSPYDTSQTRPPLA